MPTTLPPSEPPFLTVEKLRGGVRANRSRPVSRVRPVWRRYAVEAAAITGPGGRSARGMTGDDGDDGAAGTKELSSRHFLKSPPLPRFRWAGGTLRAEHGREIFDGSPYCMAAFGVIRYNNMLWDDHDFFRAVLKLKLKIKYWCFFYIIQ